MDISALPAQAPQGDRESICFVHITGALGNAAIPNEAQIIDIALCCTANLILEAAVGVVG